MNRLTALLFGIFFIANGYANSSESTITKDDVAQLLKNWQVAFATKDTDLLAQVLDDNWVYSGGADGKTSGKKDSITQLQNADYTVTNMEFSDFSVRYYGNIAIVTAKEKLHIKGLDGKVSYVNLRFTDVYRKVNGVTRAISTHSSPITEP